MTYYAVIDTNVIVSSMLKRDSFPGKVLDYVLHGTIVPLLNDDILSEYIDVLSRNEFGFSISDVDELQSFLQVNGIFLNRTKVEDIFPDPDDAVFYEVALTARNVPDAYLVTGSIKHFPSRSFVVTPREMVEIIEKISL